MRKGKHKIREIGKQLLAVLLCMVLVMGEFEVVVSAAEIEAEQETSVPEATEPEMTEADSNEEEESIATVPEEQEAEVETSETEISETGTLQNNDTTVEGTVLPVSEELEENFFAVDDNFPNVVYVGKQHGDGNIESAPWGQTPAYPYPTLEDAYQYVTDGGTIKVVDELALGSWPTNANKNVTIEGWTGEIAGVTYSKPTILMEGDWTLKGDTTIQKLTIKQNTSGTKTVYPEGHRIQIGSGEKESVKEDVKNGPVVPRVADTSFRDKNNGQSGWFQIGTGPADGIHGEHIEKVDVHIYGGGNGVKNFVSVIGRGNEGSDVNTVTTPNLETIEIEIIGSSKERLSLPPQFWVNGMAPAFDGNTLKTADITLGYADLSTHSLFRPTGDSKDKRGGDFSLKYTLDKVTLGGSSEAVAFGEAYTTGGMTIDVWDSTFTGSSQRGIFVPCVGAGSFGELNINLHNSSLQGLGNHHIIHSKRNEQLQYDVFNLTLDNSHITDHTAFQDNMNITLRGQSSIGNLNYYPKTESTATTACVIKNEGTAEIGSIDANPADIENVQGADLTLFQKTAGIRNIKNAGNISLKEAQTWQGNYTGGTETTPGKLTLLTGATLDIKGTVSGTTDALAEQAEIGSPIATILAEKGKKECITWKNTEGTKTELDGYWSINLGEDIVGQDGFVYVRYGGSDKNQGTSYNDAVKSLCKAYELATVAGTEHKKIVICDAYVFSDTCAHKAQHSQIDTPVVMTTTDGVTDFGEGYGAKLLASTYTDKNKPAGGVSLQHAFEFQHITITDSVQTPENKFLNIYANGHPTIMGEGTAFVPYTSVFGGSESDEVAGTSLRVLDGTYFHIYGGNYKGEIEGDINLRVEKADFRTPGYGEDDTMSIVGGNREGTVKGNISVTVIPEEGQEITNVLRIVGGNYTSGSVTGNLTTEISGDVSFQTGTSSPVNNAIVGGCFKLSPVTGNIKLTVHDIIGTGMPYIIGGNGWTSKVDGNIDVDVDNVRANRMIGGCGWTYSSTTAQNHWGSVTGDIVMNIGKKGYVEADSIYGCSGDMGSSAVSTGNKEYKPRSMTMNLGQVSAGIVSGGLMGITVSDDTRKVLNLNIQGESQIRELLEFADINVAESAVLIYNGMSLTGDRLNNNGTIRYQEGNVSVKSDYVAGTNAQLQLNSHTTVTHEKGISGRTKVSSVTGKSALTVRAKTEKITEQDKANSFVSTNSDMPLEYSTEEEMSVWKYNPSGEGIYDFVYVDGTKGNDEWSGTKPTKGENVEANQGGEEITLGPVKTLERAYELIKDGGYIIVCGKTAISRWPNVQKKAFITSDASLVPTSKDNTDYRKGNTDEQGEENTGLFFNPRGGNKYIVLEDDLTLRNLDFHYEYDGLYGGVDANGNTLIIGDESDTGLNITEIEPDVRFYKIQDGKRMTPDTFLLVGGGIFDKTPEKIHLEVYNTEVKAVIALWGGTVEEEKRVVSGNVTLKVQDCKTQKGLYYCSYDSAVDATDSIRYKGGYGEVQGDAEVEISLYNSQKAPHLTSLAQLCGLKLVKNLGNGKLHYINATDRQPRMYNECEMFHAAKKCSITYENIGTGSIDFDRFYPVDRNTGMDGGEDTQVEITLLGNITIPYAALNRGVQDNSENISVVLNLGDKIQGSKGINFTNTSGQFISSQYQTERNCYKSYRINYYPGADVKFDLGLGAPITTEQGDYPVVALQSLQSDLENGTQTEHILEAPDFVNKAVLECNNSKAVRTVDTEDRLYDLRLVKGGSYTYNQDDFQLNGKLSMEAGTKLITNGTVSIENDLKLKENVIFPVEYFLTVNGKIDSEKNASLLVNNAALITVGGAAGNTRVDFNGDTNNNPKGHFEIRAKKGENAEAYAEERFTGGTAIDLTYKDKEPYVTWTYGTLEPLDEIFLDGKNGEEGNSGNRPEEAVQTLQQALEHAVSSGNPETDEIQIVISGKYTFEKDKDGTLPNELLEKLKEKKIVITQNADSIDTTYNSKVSIENGFEIPCSLTFEKIRLSFSGDNPELYAGGNALTIGEGVIVQTDKKYPSIYGGHNSETVEGSTEVNIYSGTWFRIYGGGKSGTVNGNTQVTLGDDLTKAAPVIKTETEKDYSSETNAVFGGGQSGEVTGTAQVTVNYGKDYGYIFGGSESGTVNNTEVSVKDAQIYRIYGGSYDGTVSGNAKINFHSGSANRIYGGGSTNKTSVASTEVNIGKERKDASSATVKDYLRGSGEQGGVTGKAVLNIKDGALITKDCKAAAGGYTGGVARSILNISGGEVQTDIYAGGAGEFKMDNNGTLLDEIDPTKGVVSASEVHVTGGNVTGSVYGGGNMGSVGTAEKPTGDNVTVAEITGGIITGDFYGGGSLAPTHGNICMTLNMSNDANIGGGAFGGGKGRAPEGSKAGVAANVEGNITVTVQSAHVETGIYGGCNLNGSVENSQVNVSAPADCRIYGAGLGAETYVEKTNIDLNLQDPLLMTEKEEKNEYTVYGGGEQGKTGTSNVNIQNWVGNVYGGGRGVAEAAGFANSVKSVFQETANTEIAAFSGEKPFTILGLKDANTKETNVTISGKFMGNAYGGGELATVGEENNGTVGAGAGTPVTNVTIENGAQVTGNIYGGGKGEPNQDFAKIYGDTSVVVNGGIVQSDENVSDSCVFGGGEIAPVKGNTNVTVSSGHVQNVFGGNDRSGKISGNTNVTIEGGEADNVYGGGRNAAYNDTSSDVSTQVVIKGGTVGNAYGGGYGSSAICQNTSLTIKGGQTGTAFAGGNAATVANKAVLNVNVPKTDGNTPPDVTTIFAGNNQAAMNIQPTINLTSGKIGTFYGGGNQGDMTIENGLSYGEKTFGSADISIDTVYGGCNNADVTDGATLELSKGTYGEVYGGNNAGGEAHQSNVILNGEQLNVTTVYGGGNKASIEKTSITALNGEIGNIYGGGNEATAKESVHLQTKGNVTITNV